MAGISTHSHKRTPLVDTTDTQCLNTACELEGGGMFYNRTEVNFKRDTAMKRLMRYKKNMHNAPNCAHQSSARPLFLPSSCLLRRNLHPNFSTINLSGQSAPALEIVGHLKIKVQHKASLTTLETHSSHPPLSREDIIHGF